jgi:hypothetical protein
LAISCSAAVRFDTFPSPTTRERRCPMRYAHLFFVLAFATAAALLLAEGIVGPF